MSQLNLIFRIVSFISILGWGLIVFLPSWAYTSTLTTFVVVALLCVFYVYLLFFARPQGISKPQGSFFTLAGILQLFQNPRAVLAGWVHFLAFDLMVALWIRSDAASHNIAHGWLVPIYLLTLMFGPAGLLAYFGLLALRSL
jgi:Domain of unknown function (DUF4281)